MWWFLWGLAQAQEEVIQLPEVTDLPSVLVVDEIDERTLLRHRFAIRPDLGVVFLDGDPLQAGARLGGTLRHNWWTVPPLGTKRTRWGGTTTASGSGVVGFVKGWRSDLYTTAGPSWGLFSLRLGGGLRGDRVVTKRSDVLEDALYVGPRADVLFDFGPVSLWGAVYPGFLVTEADRGNVEWEGQVGMASRVPFGAFLMARLGVDVRTQFTTIGTLTEVRLVFHMGLGVNR